MDLDAVLLGQSKEVQLAHKIEEIFFPVATEQRREHLKFGGRFAHYTSADAALKIIRSKRIWLRNTTCMSDFREVDHGFDLLHRYFSNRERKDAFFKAIDQVSPGAAAEAIKHFDEWLNVTRNDTYIASYTEHRGGNEDSIGRLSMWRAFGGTSRVALVFRPPIFTGAGARLAFHFSPVAYLLEDGVRASIEKLIENVQKNEQVVRALPKDTVTSAIFNALFAAVVSLKHHGFEEEREWRVIHAPKRWPSDLVKSRTELVGGVPQTIYELPIDGALDPQLVDLDLAAMFDRLIIGPTQFASAMYDTFVRELSVAGVKDAGNRVVVSDIPIRT